MFVLYRNSNGSNAGHVTMQHRRSRIRILNAIVQKFQEHQHVGALFTIASIKSNAMLSKRVMHASI